MKSCQDLSKAGQGAGLQGGKTRSGLVYEVLRLLHELHEVDNLPKVLIMENVVDLVQVNYVDEWNRIALEMESEFSYKHYLQILNARDYGVAQNRQRVFMVSILGNWNYNFPRPIDLEYRLKDYLEDEVDESLYLSEKMLKFFEENTRKNKEKGNGFKFSPTDGSDVAKTITTRNGSRMDDNFLVIPEATKAGFDKAYDGDGIYINRPHQKRGVVQTGMTPTIKAHCSDIGVVVEGDNAKRTLCNTMIANELVEEGDMIRYSYTNNRMEDLSRKENEKGVSATLTTRPDTLGAVEPKENYLRIRKLSPRETARLMGMQDYQFDKQIKVTSNAQAYKQHDNGIVAQVIGKIIGMMWYEDENELRDIVNKNSHTWIKEKEND